MTRKGYMVGGAVLLVILAVVGGWYYVSPGITVKAMVDAAKANDEAAFSAYVDYAALRTDLKSELSSRLQEEATRDGSAEAKLGLAMGMAMMGPIVDSMVSPAGMKTAFANLAKEQESVKGDGEKAQKGSIPADPKIRRDGFNRFVVTGKDTPESGLVFERRGLSWKLTGIDLPPLPAKPAAR
ncbi:MAG TPA: DUF2939 domain-containing protein [Allosphingosinicella sp.]